MGRMFFEGPEKKVELAVARGSRSLRGLGDEFWGAVVEAAGAKVLSKSRSEELDAYLLSESSLFVADGWLTMITCGRTDLVGAIERILSKVRLAEVQYLIYERKNAHFQEYQPSNFYDDARRLGGRMPGKAFRFGDGDDHHVFVFHLDRPYTPDAEDFTLEILMHGIDPAASRIFMQGPGRTKGFIRERSGAWALLPGFTVDDHLFEPMGYSLNALRGSRYYTLHVTPQKGSSYVSFETNCLDDTEGTLARVLDLFRPHACDILLFSPAGRSKRVRCPYSSKRAVRQTLGCGYTVSFEHHFKPRARPMPAFEIAL